MGKLETHRSISLDVMRGCAVLLVMFCHLPVAPESAILRALARGGWVGVDLFFILSGFLVSGLIYKEYLKTQKLDILRFLIRRGFKIYPSLYFIVFLLTFFAAQYGVVNTNKVMCESFFLANYCDGFVGGTWSLAVEEHFYLLFALLVFFLTRNEQKPNNPFSVIPKLYIVLAISCLVLRIITTPNELPVNFQTDLFPTHLRIDSLALGTTIAYFYHFQRKQFLAFGQRYRFLCLFLGILLLLPAFIWEVGQHEYIVTYGLLQFQIAAGMILIAVVSFNIPSHILSKPIALIGLYSYPIYIWNFTFRTLFASSNLKYFLINLVFGIFLGIAFEAPILKIRDRLFPAHIPAKPDAYPITVG